MNPRSFLIFLPVILLHPNAIAANASDEGDVGFLSTSSRWIVDQRGSRVKLACVNWAAHLEPVVPEGLDKQPADKIASAVRSMGFNCVRLTWPVHLAIDSYLSSLTVDESLRRLGLFESADGVTLNNPQLLHLTLFDAFQEVVSTLGRHRLMVVLDNHISTPGWCCSKKDDNGFFGDKFFNSDEWIKGLKIMAATFNTTTSNVVGMSLRNELRGPRQNVMDWYRYMQMGAEAVHSVNPNVLVILSGLKNDKTLAFLQGKQVDLMLHGKLVFELHWYSFSDGQNWENGNTNAVCGNISSIVMANGGFLLKQGWPLFLSEFGVDIMGKNSTENHFLSCFLSVAAELDLDWAIWALQGSYYIREGQSNYDENYGLLSWDWGKAKNPKFLQRISAIQSPFQGPGLPIISPYNVVFHPLTGLCIQKDKLNGKPVLGSCAEYVAWYYTSQHNLVLKDSELCLQAAAKENEVEFGTNCERSSSKWELITASQMLLSTKTCTNSSTVCLDIDSSDDRTIITSTCKCLLEKEGPCSAESQWFKIIYSNRGGG